MRNIIRITLLTIALMGSELSAQLSAPLIIIVRHAEKAAAPADDPPLTPAGVARAGALEQAVAFAGVTAIVTTEVKRNRETIAGVAQKRGITPEVVPVRGVPLESHIQAVAAAIRKHSSGVVLVVGHSNTVPAIIAALGGPRFRDICDADYDNLFLLSTDASGVRLVTSRYGAPDQVELNSVGCTPM